MKEWRWKGDVISLSRIFENKIPSTVKVGESIYYGLPIALYSKKASAGIAYRKFAKELIAYEG